MLAHTFVDVSGETCHATGLLDAHMEPAALADGPVVTYANDALGLPPLSGYEFHHLHAIRAAPAQPLAEVEVGVGDRLVGAQGKATDGAVGDRMVGTWLHGPLLPRNPALAEMLLRWARPDLAEDAANAALMVIREMDEMADSIRAQRMAEARRSASH
jgi:CobQ-like glutamine amidotransferase family enzyme